MFSTTTTSTGRDATGPIAGGARASVWTAAVTYVAAKAAAAPSDPALGELAGQFVHAYGPEVIAVGAAVVSFLATAGRKKLQNWIAEA